MVVTLVNSTLYDIVERSLSVIGKRSTDDKGNLLFTDITLGSREVPLIYDYFRQAFIDLATELSAFITAQSETAITLTFPSNHNPILEPFVQKACEAYCVSYALNSWFTVTAPRIAEKYSEDCRRQLSAVIRLINEKQPPQASSFSPLNISTTVSE